MTDKEFNLDSILASFEDYMHGFEGYEVTMARKLLSEIIKENNQSSKEHCLNMLNWQDKVMQTEPMRFETDNDDIVEMYFEELTQ